MLSGLFLQLPCPTVEQHTTIRIEPTQYFSTKSGTCRRQTEISDKARAMLVEREEEAQGYSVIESDLAPKEQGTSPRERCRTHFKKVRAWLETKGITAQKKVQELRKECSSQMVKKHGIPKASIFLGHSSIDVTFEHYADVSGSTTAELGD